MCGQLAARTNQGSLFCSLGWVNCLLTFSVVNREKSRGRMCICVCVSVCRTEMPIQQLKRDHCRAQLPPLAPYRPSIPLTPSVYPSLYFTPHISTGSTFLFFFFFFFKLLHQPSLFFMHLPFQSNCHAPHVFKGGIFPCVAASCVLYLRMSHAPHLSFFSEL